MWHDLFSIQCTGRQKVWSNNEPGNLKDNSRFSRVSRVQWIGSADYKGKGNPILSYGLPRTSLWNEIFPTWMNNLAYYILNSEVLQYPDVNTRCKRCKTNWSCQSVGFLSRERSVHAVISVAARSRLHQTNATCDPPTVSVSCHSVSQPDITQSDEYPDANCEHLTQLYWCGEQSNLLVLWSYQLQHGRKRKTENVCVCACVCVCVRVCACVCMCVRTKWLSGAVRDWLACLAGEHPSTNPPNWVGTTCSLIPPHISCHSMLLRVRCLIPQNACPWCIITAK